MTTVHDVVDRTFRQWLNRSDDRQLDVRANGAAVAAASSIVLHLTELTNEEIALISPGTILEAHLELMRVVSLDESTATVTVVRGIDGTTAADISDGDPLKVSPSYNRLDVYEAVSDSIRELWPDLYLEATEILDLDSGVLVLETAGVAGIIEATTIESGEPVALNSVRNSAASDSGWGVRVPNFTPSMRNLEVEVRVKVRALRPAACTDDIANLYVQRDWVEILVVGAAAKMLPGREIDRTTIEYLTEALEAQGLRLGEQFDLGASLLSLREALIEKHQRAILVDEGMRVEYTQVI